MVRPLATGSGFAAADADDARTRHPRRLALWSGRRGGRSPRLHGSGRDSLLWLQDPSPSCGSSVGDRCRQPRLGRAGRKLSFLHVARGWRHQRFRDGARAGAATAPEPRALTHRERHSNDHARWARGHGEREEVAHCATRVTERTRQRFGQRQRTGARIDRSIAAAAGERAGAEYVRAHRLPPLLDG